MTHLLSFQKLWFCVLMRRRDNASILEISYLLCIPENKLFTAYTETYALFHEVWRKSIFIRISVQKGGQIYLHIQHYFNFVPKYASQNSNTYSMPQQPAFCRASLLLLLGGVLEKSLIRLSSLSARVWLLSPVFDSLWSFFKHHLTSWGRSDFYQLQSFSLNPSFLFLSISNS